MATPQLHASTLQEPTKAHHDIISSLLDLDDELFQQELQDIENHFFNFDQTDPISSSSSSSSSLPIQEGSPFMLDLLQPNIQNHQPILPVEQCVQPADVYDTFLNDYEFGLISPTDLSSEINNINDQLCETMISGLVNPTGDVEIISGPVVATDNVAESNKTDDDYGTDEDRPKKGALNSKNMVSERNRRKRLSNQLLSLRALVPNITKMDKRSVLVDAQSYLRKIHEETEMLQLEIKKHLTGRPMSIDLRECNEDTASETFGIPSTTTKSKAQIIKIETEKIEDKRFIVKITCNGGGVGVGGDVLRVFESLDYEITYTALQQQLQPQQVLATIYVRVRKQGMMTEQKLRDSITTMALKIGLSLPNPNP